MGVSERDQHNGGDLHKATLMIRNLAIGVSLCATAGGTALANITLTPFTGFFFNNPIGIDFHEETGTFAPGRLLMSVNYPTGAGHNFDLVSAGGSPTQFSNIAGFTEEVKIATVRAGSCQGGFAVGEAFAGNGNPGAIVRISADGSTVSNPWVTLPGETARIRGSLFQDRFCAAGGDLIVVTGNEEVGTAGDLVGNVWRITQAGVPTKVATLNKHLEGVTTVPNDPGVYGPLAGRIVAGDEDFIGAPACTGSADPSTCNGANGKIFAVNPNGLDDYFTIGNGTGVAGHTHYPTAVAFNPEDLDIIRGNAEFFGVAFRDGEVLTAAAADFNGLCGQVLITQEFPWTVANKGLANGTLGLSALKWDTGTSAFIVTPLVGNRTVQQWEHTTFTSGQDCFGLRVVKTPDKGDAGSVFTQGSQVQFKIVVTNTGATAYDPVVNPASFSDQLPTNGGLTWASAVTDNGSSCSISASQLLTCSNLGNIAAGASVTITVTSTATTPAAACQDQPNFAATATDTHGNTAKDDGFLTCTPPPPHLMVVKTPDGGTAGTFTQGGAVSLTIVVSNDGGSDETNAKLSDQLPTNGGLNWFGATVTTSQGSCSVSATSLLTCSFLTIPKGGSVTVTVSLASTPAAACQSQPNPHAIATADGPLTAEDSGSLTCTPPTPGGLIAPTSTSCQDFANGTASALGQINYPVSNGKIGQGINPGVFFYYTKITTTVANQVVTVSESQNDAAALFQVHQGQAYLYTANCSSSTKGTLISGDTGASFTVATAGTYIIGIKYSTKSIVGTSAPTSDPVTYTFTTSLGASTSAKVLLKKQ